MIQLVSVGGDVTVAEISLQLPAVVGRSRDVALTLPHPLVSRRHCELYESSGKLMVRDLGSLNGTYVGSQRIIEAEVPPGELLTVATVNFRVVYHRDARRDNATESPLLGRGDDSTLGIRKTPEAGAARAASATKTTPEAALPEEKKGPIERDTQWQAGMAPPRDDPSEETDGDDLNTLLNGH
ncbi:MAG: FHA domain-containing protein [Pirellulaceae bacterium]